MTSGMVLAHQGGWDEMLMVAAPVGLFVFLLWVANARAARQRDAGAPEPRSAADRSDTSPTGDTGDTRDTEAR